MKNRIFVYCIALALMAAGVSAAQAQHAPKAEPAPKAEMPKKAVVTEKVGVIEVVKAEKNQKFDTVLLKVGEESIKLLPAKGNKEFKGLEKLAGKEVIVTGEMLPPNPPKYPLAAIKVATFKVKEAAAKPAAK